MPKAQLPVEEEQMASPAARHWPIRRAWKEFEEPGASWNATQLTGRPPATSSEDESSGRADKLAMPAEATWVRRAEAVARRMVGYDIDAGVAGGVRVVKRWCTMKCAAGRHFFRSFNIFLVLVYAWCLLCAFGVSCSRSLRSCSYCASLYLSSSEVLKVTS